MATNVGARWESARPISPSPRGAARRGGTVLIASTSCTAALTTSATTLAPAAPFAVALALLARLRGVEGGGGGLRGGEIDDWGAKFDFCVDDPLFDGAEVGHGVGLSECVEAGFIIRNHRGAEFPGLEAAHEGVGEGAEEDGAGAVVSSGPGNEFGGIGCHRSRKRRGRRRRGGRGGGGAETQRRGAAVREGAGSGGVEAAAGEARGRGDAGPRRGRARAAAASRPRQRRRGNAAAEARERGDAGPRRGRARAAVASRPRRRRRGDAATRGRGEGGRGLRRRRGRGDGGAGTRRRGAAAREGAGSGGVEAAAGEARGRGEGRRGQRRRRGRGDGGAGTRRRGAAAREGAGSGGVEATATEARGRGGAGPRRGKARAAAASRPRLRRRGDAAAQGRGEGGRGLRRRRGRGALRAVFQCSSGQNCGGAERFPVREPVGQSGSLWGRAVVPIALRAVFQCSGQNCIGAERFFVQAGIYDQFVGEVVSVAQQMRLGYPLADELEGDEQDGMNGGREKATAPASQQEGQFYPPTVLVNVRPTMRILHEEVFGPIMCIVKFENDLEVVAAANDCPFGLGCSVFSGDRRRAAAIGAAVQCGMVAINDFGCTYMCQSLPFGGVKESGFGRFAGVEGLRGCCNEKAIVEDRFYSLIKTNIPPPLQVGAPGYPIVEDRFYSLIKTNIPLPLQYPLAPNAVPIQQALVRMFFAHTLLAQLSGLFHPFSLLRRLKSTPSPLNPPNTPVFHFPKHPCLPFPQTPLTSPSSLPPLPSSSPLSSPLPHAQYPLAPNAMPFQQALYPLAPNAVPFQQALVRMFFAHTLLAQLSGLFHLLLELMRSPKRTNTQQRPSSAAHVAGAGAMTSAARRNSGVAASGGERPHNE
ncbi:unnamed protein product [Closterium sp. NIES-64]|nr:unnamed protein product [Closterium sp. NIES-64]